MNELYVDVVSTIEHLNRVEQDWNKFLTKNPNHTIYHTPEYWKSEFATLGQSAHFVILYRSGKDNSRQLVALAPFVRQKSKLVLKLGVLKLFGVNIERVSLRGNAIAVADTESLQDVVGIILRSLKENQLTLVSFDCLPVNGELCRILQSNRNNLPGSFRFRIIDQQVLRGIAFQSDFDNYMTSMSKKTRYNLRRSVKQFSIKSSSDPQLVKVDKEQDVESFLVQLDEIFKQSWQAKTFGYKPRADSSTIEHHRSLARHGLLRSYLLVSDSKAVAFIRGYQYQGLYYFEEIGYDAEWRDFQPGTVLNLLAIEEMFSENRPDTLDFGYGENDYKRILGNTECPAAVASLVTRGSKAALLLSSQRILNSTYSAVRSVLSTLGLENAVRKLIKRR